MERWRLVLLSVCGLFFEVFKKEIIYRMLLVGGLICICHFQVAVAAQVGQTITVTATVAPAVYVIVDDKSQIRKIISNSEQYVTPTIYKSRITPQTKMQPTGAILTQYTQLISEHRLLGPGVVYDSGIVYGRTISMQSVLHGAKPDVTILQRLSRVLPLRIRDFFASRYE